MNIMTQIPLPIRLVQQQMINQQAMSHTPTVTHNGDARTFLCLLVAFFIIGFLLWLTGCIRKGIRHGVWNPFSCHESSDLKVIGSICMGVPAVILSLIILAGIVSSLVFG